MWITNHDDSPVGPLVSLNIPFEKVKQKPLQQQSKHYMRDSCELQRKQKQQAQAQQRQMD